MCIEGNDVNCKKYYKDIGYSDLNDVFWTPYDNLCTKLSEVPLCPDDYTLTKYKDGFMCLKNGIETNFTEVINNCMNEDIYKKTGNEQDDQNNARFQVENCIRGKLNINLNKEKMFDPNVEVESLDLGHEERSLTNNFKSTFRKGKKNTFTDRTINTLISDILSPTPDNDNVNPLLDDGKVNFYNKKGALSNIPSIV